MDRILGTRAPLVLQKWRLDKPHLDMSDDTPITYCATDDTKSAISSSRQGTLSTPASMGYQLKVLGEGGLHHIGSNGESYRVDVEISLDPKADNERHPTFEALLPHQWV